MNERSTRRHFLGCGLGASLLAASAPPTGAFAAVPSSKTDMFFDEA